MLYVVTTPIQPRPIQEGILFIKNCPFYENLFYDYISSFSAKLCNVSISGKSQTSVLLDANHKVCKIICDLTLNEPRQANLCLRAFRHDKL